MNKKNHVTQADIADSVGISKIAVSYALRGAPNISEATRKKVFQVADKLGYRINNSARATRTGKFNSFGLLLGMGASTSTLPHQLLLSLAGAVSNLGKNLLVGRFNDSVLSDVEQFPQFLQQHVVDALLIYYTHQAPEKLGKMLKKKHMPTIWANIRQKKDCIYHDDIRAGEMMVESLLKRDCRNIAYITQSLQKDTKHVHYSVGDRQKGYEKAIKNAHLTPLVINLPSLKFPTQRYKEAICFVRKHSELDGIVAYSFQEALGFALAAKDSGRTIGEDFHISVVGTRQHYIADYSVPVIAFDFPAFGQEAATMLEKKQHSPQIALPPKAIAPLGEEWLLNHSIAKPVS